MTLFYHNHRTIMVWMAIRPLIALNIDIFYHKMYITQLMSYTFFIYIARRSNMLHTGVVSRDNTVVVTTHLLA